MEYREKQLEKQIKIEKVKTVGFTIGGVLFGGAAGYGAGKLIP